MTSNVESVLRAAGWFPGRWVDVPDLPGHSPHATAAAFLREFGNLEIDVPIDGCPEIQGFVHFDPQRAAPFLRTDFQLATIIPEPVYPVGTTSGHTVLILLSESGRMWLLRNEHELFGQLSENVVEGLETLCDGRNGRVDGHILQNGRPTGEVITSSPWQKATFGGVFVAS